MRIKWILLASVTVAPMARGNENAAQIVAQSRSQIRDSIEPRIEAARTLEKRGQFAAAIALWQKIKKQSGAQTFPSQSSAPTYKIAQVADFYGQRLRRKRNLAARPAKIDSALRHRIARAATDFGDSDQLELAVQADLDGDLIDEIFYMSTRGSLGQPNKTNRKTMGIAKWNGRAYSRIWHSEKAIPFMVHIVDEDGDGWKEIFCGYTPDSDDAATLHFNGQTVLFQ